jgi:hypothetical protein
MKRIFVATGLLATFLLASLTSLAQTQSRSDIRKEIETKRAELVALEKSYLEPSQDDQMLYAEFLRQPGTGLIRLLPREKFDSEAYTTNKKTITMRGGGAYYSFSRLTHEYGYGSDLSLDGGQFQVGFAGADYGFMTNLGDVPLESIGLDTPVAKPLATYTRVKHEPDARIEYRRFAQGAEIDGVPVSNRLPMQLNSTYLLRAVNYGQADVLVAFRVVKTDSDGSALILWKLLKKYRTPQLARNN